MLEVDLKYPKELHLEHSDIHQHQKNLTYKKNGLSDYCLKIVNEHNIKIGSIKNYFPM